MAKLLSLLVLTVSIGLVLPPVTGPVRAQIVDVPQSDQDMKVAIAAARMTLPVFWEQMARPGPGVDGFALKVGLPTDNAPITGPEHVWVNSIERLADEHFAGHLANEPRGIAGKKVGDRVEFKQAQISDWLFMRNGKIVGFRTMEPMIKQWPKEQAAQLRAKLEQP